MRLFYDEFIEKHFELSNFTLMEIQRMKLIQICRCITRREQLIGVEYRKARGVCLPSNLHCKRKAVARFCMKISHTTARVDFQSCIIQVCTYVRREPPLFSATNSAISTWQINSGQYFIGQLTYPAKSNLCLEYAKTLLINMKQVSRMLPQR